MKSEHRHELKTNELAEWIMNFPQWAKENRTTIIYVSALIVAVAAIYIWRGYSKNVVAVQEQLEFTRLITQLPQSKMQILQAQGQGIDYSYKLIQTADNLQDAARGTKNDTIAALALIKRADILRAELLYRPGQVDEQNATAQINRAKAGYNEALGKASSNPSLMAAARFGLGLCEEELGNFKQAKQIYNEIVAEPQLEGTVASVQAKQRLETMADYKQIVVFRQPAKPAPAETELIQPQIELKPPDVNLFGPQGLQTGETSK
jgi:tetratricopeptide (TPR) repeat protein